MQTIQASAAEAGREYASPKGVVVTIMEHLPDGQVRVKNKAGREATIPGTHVLVLPETPSASVADLTGKPRDVLEPALPSLTEADLDALAQADTRAWVQHAIAAELARRTQAAPVPAPAAPPSDKEILQRAVASVAPGVQAVLQADAAQVSPERVEELRAVDELRVALTDLAARGVTVLPPHGADTERREVTWLLGQLDEVAADRLHLSAEGLGEFRARLVAADPRKAAAAKSPSRGALLDLCEGSLKWLKDHDIEQFDLPGEPGQIVVFWLEGLDEEPTERVAAAWSAAVELRKAREAQAQPPTQQERPAARRVREADRVRFEEEGAAAWKAGQPRPSTTPEGWPPRALKALQDGWDAEQRAAGERSRAAVETVLERHPEVRPGDVDAGLPDGTDDDGDDPMPGADEDDPMPGDGDDEEGPADPDDDLFTEQLYGGAVTLTVVGEDGRPEPLRDLEPVTAPEPGAAAPAESPADWLRQQVADKGIALSPEVLAAFVGLVGSVRENTAALAQPLAWEAPVLRMAIRYEEAHQRRPTIMDRLLGRLQRVEAGAKPGQRRPPTDPTAEVPVAAPAVPQPAPVEDMHGLEGEAADKARRIQANLRRVADAVPALLALQEAAAALGADGARLDLGSLLGFTR